MTVKAPSAVIVSVDEKKCVANADFEEAVWHTGFGKFNFILLLIATPVTFAILGEAFLLSYVFPAAQCDLNLTAANKGMINASVYLGMVVSILFWGALTDRFGRKRILVISLFFELLCQLVTTVTRNFWMLITTKFFGGIIVIGAITALKPFLTEFHGKQYRSKIPLIEGFLYTLGLMCLPLLAMTILRRQIDFSVFGFEFHSWNVYLLICTIPAIISGLGVLIMPETPKFLMTQGKTDKAMDVFKKIYAWNTGKPREDFPVKSLIIEKPNSNSILKQWKELCTKKYRFHLMLLCVLQLIISTVHCSFQLWLPQWYQSMNDYEKAFGPGSFCTMIFHNVPGKEQNDTMVEECHFNTDNSAVYTNALICQSCVMTAYLLASSLINYVGKKRILFVCGVIYTISLSALNFVPNSTVALVMICIITVSSDISIDTTISIVIDLFPTNLRASALSIFLLFSRVGAVVGNLVLPILLENGCGTTFYTLSMLMCLWVVLMVFLPKTDMKSLE